MNEPIPASKAIFDTHAAVRQKIEAANFAVLEAVKSMVDYQDPLAAAVFGIDEKILTSLANASKSKITALCMTGIPIFALRPDDDFFSALSGAGGEDAALRVLLSSFAESLPLGSL